MRGARFFFGSSSGHKAEPEIAAAHTVAQQLGRPRQHADKMYFSSFAGCTRSTAWTSASACAIAA